MVLSTGWSPTEKRNQHHRRHLLLRNWDRVSFSWWLRRWCLRRRWANNVLMYCAPLADAVVDGVVVSLSCWPRRWCSWWLWYPWRCWWLMTMIKGGEWLIIVPILMIINFYNSGNVAFDHDYYDHDPDDNRWSKLRECNTQASQRRELRQPTENLAGHPQLRLLFISIMTLIAVIIICITIIIV